MSVAAVLGVIVFLIAAAGLLYIFQARLIYVPRPYGPEYKAYLPSFAREVPYRTAEGSQQALYVPPRAHPAGPPERIWIMFHGNASLAMDWADLLEKDPSPAAGFLLIDYPGYGFCQGRPSPQAILESSEQAMAALARQLAIEPVVLYRHLNILGFSLGAAAALQLAGKTRPERVVLVSPFSSLIEMARRAVGWPMCYLLRHRFDNRARLDELAQAAPRPQVTIIHGNADDIVPVAMSRAMAQRYPWIRYHEIDGADHNFILTSAEPQILKAMAPDARPVTVAGKRQ